MHLARLAFVALSFQAAQVCFAAQAGQAPSSQPPAVSSPVLDGDWSVRYQTLIVGVLTFIVGGSVGLHTIFSARLERKRVAEEKRQKELTYSVVLEQELVNFREKLTTSRETIGLIRPSNDYPPEMMAALRESSLLQLPKAITDDWDRLTFLDAPMLRNLRQFMGLYADAQVVLRALSRLRGIGPVRSLFSEDDAGEEDRLDAALEDLGELYTKILDSIDSLLAKLSLRIGDLGESKNVA